MILKEIIKKFDKSTIKAGEGLESGRYPLYTCSPIVNKFLDDYLYNDEAIIVSTGGNFSIHYIKGKFNYSTDCYVFNTDKYNLKYLYYYLLSKSTDINKMFRGAGLKHLNKNEFVILNIKDISIDEQENIVNRLDKINQMITIRKKEIDYCNYLIKSQFVEMFGGFDNSKYPKSSLDKIAKVGSSHRIFTHEFVKDGIPFYRGTEITLLANGIEPTDCFYISKNHYKKISNDDTKPKIGDLLMPSICDKGQIWLVNTNKPFYYKDGRVISISLKEKNVNPRYLHYFMKNKTMEEYPKLGSGSTFAEFKIFLLKNMDVITPPIELQNKFAQIVEKIDKQKFEFENSLKKLEELQASLMKEYFG